MYIEVKDAVKKYGTGESELYALNHVSLTLEKGEICVILGPSGSGKSTHWENTAERRSVSYSSHII